eukprot:1330616-Amphidinium_carterae.1
MTHQQHERRQQQPKALEDESDICKEKANVAKRMLTQQMQLPKEATLNVAAQQLSHKHGKSWCGTYHTSAETSSVFNTIPRFSMFGAKC